MGSLSCYAAVSRSVKKKKRERSEESLRFLPPLEMSPSSIATSLRGSMWKHSASLNWKCSGPLPFGFLWRLHYISMVN